MKFRFIIVTCALFIILFLPVLTSAASTLVFCNTGDPSTWTGTNKCDWDGLISLAQRFINFLILYIAIPLSALSFAYAGFLILTAAGNSSQVSKGREVFVKVAIGLVWTLVAWLVVNVILTALLNPGYSLLGP